MHVLLLAAVIASGPDAAAPVAATPAQPDPTPAIAAKVIRASSKDKVICRQESMPGTRLVEHVICGTKAQWNDYYDVVRQDFARVGQLNFGH